MTRLPRLVRWILRACLPARDREFLLGDLEEELTARGTQAAAHRWVWHQALALIWSHGRIVRGAPRADERADEGVPMPLAISPRSIRPFSISMTDVRYAARAVASRPGLTLSLIVTLGGGIALTTVMFSVLNALLLVPLPYGDPDALVSVWERHIDRDASGREEFSPANFLDLRDRNRTFDGLAAAGDGSVNLTGAGEAERLQGQTVTWNYFQVLNVAPALGRGFAPADEQEGQPPTALISARLWARRFQGDPSIVGRSVRFDDRATTIIGVMGSDFVPPGADADLWLPMRFGPDQRRNRSGHFLNVVGRLKPAVGGDTGQADLDRITIALARESADNEQRLRTTVVPLRDQLSGAYRPTALLLLGAVSFVLLMACANAANLLLARAAGRRREMAIRVALGADRRRLRGQVLTESLIVAGAAGALGLLASVWGVTLVDRALPASLAMFAGSEAGPVLTGDAVRIALDWRVLIFTVGATMATGLLFGAMPARQASDVAAHDVLREQRTTGGVRARTRKLLVVGQLAIAVVLLVAAGLLLRSVARLQATDPGFDPEGVLTMRTVLSSQRYETAHARQRFYDAVIERVRRLPGVQSAGFATFLPLTFEGLGGSVAFADRPPASEPGAFTSARFRLVTHDYLQALRVPLRAGRGFQASDTAQAPRAALVSDAFARHVWGDDRSRALGQRIMMFRSPEASQDWLTIVGVVGAVRQSRLDKDPPLEVYALQAQWIPFPFAEPRDLAVRVAAPGDPRALAPTVRAVIREIDPEQPITDVRLLADIVRLGTADRRVYLWVLGAFALLTMALAAFGLASVMSYVITSRHKELSLRLALGASTRQVVTLVAGECVMLVVAGVAIGLGGAALAGRAMRAWLYETGPTDPLTLTLVPAVFAVCCLAACAVPLWRATKADPVAALRAD